jgi:hypothetical protein
MEIVHCGPLPLGALKAGTAAPLAGERRTHQHRWRESGQFSARLKGTWRRTDARLREPPVLSVRARLHFGPLALSDFIDHSLIRAHDGFGLSPGEVTDHHTITEVD